MEAPLTVTIAIAVLTAFLLFIGALRYAMSSTFARTRLVMTAFFCFIVITLTLAFWRYTMQTLPFTIPALILGLFAGYFVGVREAERKLMMQGLEHYLAHLTHVHPGDL